uniref:PHD-type domain-containing protein n=1 Tax=Oryza punctata TaxID=4537 RepID=A0A0E0MN37_ORYPU
MAFHVACPITCRRVCDCELGFGAAGRGKGGGWAEAAAALEGFLADPWLLRPAADGAEGGGGGGGGGGRATVQVEVPAVEVAPDEGEDEACRVAMQRQAAAAEDYARRLEGGGAAGAYGSQEEGDEEDWGQEDVGNAAVKIFSIGAHGSAPLAAVVRYVDDLVIPTSVMVLITAIVSNRRTRWFLGYTCCDACGRLFVKGNYCPVCLKVYRDSEVIPMVCCDVCEKWVHIECDGISEEKYQQFQSDQNLQYTCGACRGECSQIRDTEDAVRELWKRRDVVDHDLMASLRAAAALPSLEDVSPSHPNSDDEKLGAYVTKNDGRNILKFSFKSNSNKPVLDSSEQEKNAIKSSGSNKKHSKKKGNQNNKTVSEQDEIFLEKRNEAKSLGSLEDQIADVTRDKSSFKNDADEFVLSSAQSAEKALKSPSAKAAARNADMIPKVKIKGSKVPSLHFKDVGEENAAKSDTGKGTKLVIHIGSRHKSRSGSPKSEMSNSQKEQELVSMHGGKVDVTSQFKSSRSEIKEKSVMKLVRETGVQQNSLLGDLGASKKHATGKRSNAIVSAMENASESGTRSRSFGQKQSVNHLTENQGKASFSVNNSPDSLKPSLLKLKFKRPIFEQPSTQASQPEEPGTWVSPQEELNVAKGQRSKRKRPSLDKMDGSEGKAPAAKRHEQSTGEEAMDANWILRKLGKDAIGKRIEVQLASDGKWHQGVVSNVINGTLCLQLDNGRSENVELGKRAIRLIAQRSKGGKR